MVYRDQQHVLGICGSLRKDSYNRAVLRLLPELAPDDMAISSAPALDLPIYNDDLRVGGDIPEIVLSLADQIRSADGVIIVAPEYNHSVASPLKNAIDWMSKLENQPFQNQVFALLSASTGLLGGSRAQYHLRQILNSVQGLVLSKPEVFINFAPSKFDERFRLTDEAARELIRLQLKAFGSFIRTHGRQHALADQAAAS